MSIQGKSILLLLVTTLAICNSPVLAQATKLREEQKAIFIFDIQMDRIAFNLLSAGFEEEAVQNLTSLNHVYGAASKLPSFALIQNALNPSEELPAEFFVRFEFVSKEACQEFQDQVTRASGIEEIGKTAYRPNGWAKNIVVKSLNELTLEIGTNDYCSQPDRKFYSKIANDVWNGLPEGGARIALDLSHSGKATDELVEMFKNLIQDPVAFAFLDQIEYLSSIGFTSFTPSGELLTIISNAKDAETAKMLKGSLDSAIATRTTNIKKTIDFPPLTIGSIAATRETNMVEIEVRKPSDNGVVHYEIDSSSLKKYPILSSSLQTDCVTRYRAAIRLESSQSQDKTISIIPDPKVDEQLFMLRYLESLYLQWPTELSDGENTAQELASLRREFIRAVEFAKTYNMDEKIIGMYVKSIQLLDQYAEMLIQFEVIDREFIIKSNKRLTEGAIDSATEGFGFGGGLAVAGFEPITGTILIASFAIKKGLEAHYQHQQLDSQRKFELERLSNVYVQQQSGLLGMIEAQCEFLAKKFEWGIFEAGFADRDEQESQKIIAATESNNFGFLLERSELLKKVRPRDPFVFAGTGKLFARQASRANSHGLAIVFHELAVNDYLRAVELIPIGRFYDRLRGEYLWQAAKNASLKLYYSREVDDLPLALANLALNFRPFDPDGRLRHTKAFALARNGMFPDALELYEKVGLARGRDASFHYDQACLLSMAGKVAESMKHLKTSWSLGNKSVRDIKTDADLANIRAEKSEELSSLVNSVLDKRVEWGLVWNNVMIKNKSSYPLSNVMVRATKVSKNGSESVELYWADEIPEGATYYFEGAMNSSDLNKSTSEVTGVVHDGVRSGLNLISSDVEGKYWGVATNMSKDGSNINDTTDVTFDLDVNADGLLHFSVAGVGEVVDVTSAVGILDGVAFAESQSEKKQRLFVIFWADTAYGWFQTSPAVQNNEIFAFLVKKR